MTTIRPFSPTKTAAGLALAMIIFVPSMGLAQAPNTKPDVPPPAPTPAASDLPAPLQRPPVAEPPNSKLVQPILFEEARLVTNPGERALALARIGRAAAYSGQLEMAHTAVIEGGQAAMLEPVPLIRDQRLDSVISVALQLAEERLREPVSYYDSPEKPRQNSEKQTPARRDQLRLSAEEWRYAASLARAVHDTGARTEAEHKVIEGASFAMQTLRGEPTRHADGTARRPVLTPEVKNFITNVLELAAAEANRIERPVWRDRALVSVAQNAAAADQFDLAIKVARMIPQPEIRTDALLRIAENQALNDRPREATEAYYETAQTIATIPLDDPREVLTGVLIDSLISLGRFDDARESAVLYSTPARRTIALAAVAESQGRRGLDESARKWIALEPPEIRSVLYRRVNDGLLSSLQMNRSKDSANPDPARRP